MADLRDKTNLTDKLLLLALVLFIGVPAAALAGWLIWFAADNRPWLMWVSIALLAAIYIFFPPASWLKRQSWFMRLAGDVRTQKQLREFLTIVLPVTIIVAVDDLERGESFGTNLWNYGSTIAVILILLMILQIAGTAFARWWKVRRAEKGAAQ